MKSETLVVGIGSSHGDDQLGWQVAERLGAVLDRPDVTIRRALSPVDILGWLDTAGRLIVCDACQNLGAPGRLHHWRWPDEQLSQLRVAGSHDLGISAALSLADRLGLLPSDTLIWCAEGSAFGYDRAMSPAVQAAVAELVECIQSEFTRTHV